MSQPHQTDQVIRTVCVQALELNTLNSLTPHICPFTSPPTLSPICFWKTPGLCALLTQQTHRRQRRYTIQKRSCLDIAGCETVKVVRQLRNQNERKREHSVHYRMNKAHSNCFYNPYITTESVECSSFSVGWFESEQVMSDMIHSTRFLLNESVILTERVI